MSSVATSTVLGLKMVSGLSVIESRISTTIEPHQATAINLLHGDHTTAEMELLGFLIEILGSHEVDSPCTILMKGWACDSYNFLTIDV